MTKYIENCHKMALLAQYAYLDKKEAKSEMRKLGYTTHGFIENDGAQVHIITNRDEVVVCFRGTEPKEFSDIKADLNALPDRAFNGSGFVHNGFQMEVDKVWDKITKYLEDKTKNKNLFITGHSLGGAMATIATSRLKGVTALYTYGSPRVGTRKFVASFNVPHFRHVNNNDLVTSVPPSFFGYKHHSDSRYINYYGNIRPLTRWQRIKDQWRGRWRALKKGMPFDGAYDHGIQHYCKYTEINDD